MKPTIILSLGRPRLLQPGAIAIDLKNNCFWRGVRRRPKPQLGPGSIGYKSARFRLLAILVMRSPAIVTNAEIDDFIWADDINGGADNPRNYVSKRMEFARRGPSSARKNPILDWLGTEVTTIQAFGYRLEFTEHVAKSAP